MKTPLQTSPDGTQAHSESQAGDWNFCPRCSHRLAWREAMEDGGPRLRLRCTACDFTHWNNPTPVLAAIVQCSDRGDRVLLARNTVWPNQFHGLITGFMEAGETAEEGIRREVQEETSLEVHALSLVGVYEYQRLNQVIIAYHARARGEIRLSPELCDYRLFEPHELRCWPQGTGQALAQWLRQQDIEPRWLD